MVRTVGFLHTAPVHVATFDSLVAELAPGWNAVHHVDEGLLERARVDGIEAVEPDVDRALRRLFGRNPEMIVCTCSTIGGVAERLAGDVGGEVVRVDRPMAELAVGSGRRIAVVAALSSTVAPTTDLLAEVSDLHGLESHLDVIVVDGAWDRFEAGDLVGYHAAIADRLPAVAERVDVIVLAQASMAGVVDIARSVGAPVLASPRVAVARLLAD